VTQCRVSGGGGLEISWEGALLRKTPNRLAKKETEGKAFAGRGKEFLREGDLQGWRRSFLGLDTRRCRANIEGKVLILEGTWEMEKGDNVRGKKTRRTT